jgi:vacuolar protein sorting-associated protein 72
MADESEDTPMRDDDTPMRDDNTPMRTEDDESDSESGSDSEEEQVEWMVTARQKRSTAGNRLSSLIQQEEPDDELELLFAEDDDDAGFEDAEEDSDVQMDSSDDDDDQGPAAGADDLEGEKELQRQAKAEKAKKRKNDGIPIFKKKVKIDPTASQAPPPRPKKKSERTSWIPTAEELPTRASQRGTTKLQKKALHSQLVDREFKRLKQLENMEKAAAAKEAAKKPAMTQADRLAEAARVEKANARSLSRWEEAEQLREEEQRAKLAALSNRHLEGPVITWWSGLAQWVGGRLKQVGKTLIAEEPKEKPAVSKKRKLAEMEAESEATTVEASKAGDEAPQSKPDPSTKETSSLETGTSAEPPKSSGQTLPQPPTPAPQAEPIPPEPKTEVPELPVRQASQQDAPPPSGPLQPPPSQQNTPPPSGSLQPPPSQPPFPPPRQAAPSHPPFILAPPQPWNPHLQPPIPQSSLDGTAPIPGLGFNPNPPPPQLPSLMPSQPPLAFPTPPPAKPETPPPPAQETTSRNLLILSNFDEVQVKSKDVQTQILFGRKFPKASSKSLPPYPFQI